MKTVDFSETLAVPVGDADNKGHFLTLSKVIYIYVWKLNLAFLRNHCVILNKFCV